MGFDKTHKLDVTSRLDPNQARKWLSEVLHANGLKVALFTKHCHKEMQNDSLNDSDIYKVLKNGQIYSYPEFEGGSYRYRVETQGVIVVIAFAEPNVVWCVTAWRKL